MKFLHTSDWHLGAVLHGLSLLEEQAHFLQQLYQIAEEEAVDAILLSGDIYDTGIAAQEAIRLYHQAMEELCLRQKRTVFVIAGNHDSAVRLSAMQKLVRTSGLFVRGTLADVNVPEQLGSAAVYQIPYFHVQNVRALYPELTIESMEQAMQVLCDKIRETMDRRRTNILMAHAYVGGAVLSESDRSALVGGASMISRSVFEGFDYVALGHLHRPQNVGERIRYSGSPVAYSFGEAGQQKSVTLFDTETGEVSVRKLQPLRAMRVWRGAYADIMEKDGTSTDYLKVEFTDRFADRAAMERLKERYPNLLTVTGRAPESQQEASFSPEHAAKLSPEQILEYFLQDVYGETPTEEQKALWKEMLLQAEEER